LAKNKLPIRIGPAGRIVAGGDLRHKRTNAFVHRYDYLRAAGFTAHGLRDFGLHNTIEFEERRRCAELARDNGIALYGSMPWSHPSHYDVVSDGKRPLTAGFVLAREALHHEEFGCTTFTVTGGPKELATVEQEKAIIADAVDLIKQAGTKVKLHLANTPNPAWNWHDINDVIDVADELGITADLYAPTYHAKGLRSKKDWSTIMRKLGSGSLLYCSGYERDAKGIRMHTAIGLDERSEVHNRQQEWQGFVEAALTWNKDILVDGGRAESSTFRVLYLALDHLGIPHEDFEAGRAFKHKHFEPAAKHQLDARRQVPGFIEDDDD
jgi:hypothetical protein